MLDQTLFESLPEDVATLPSRVLSSLSSVKLLDIMEPKYDMMEPKYDTMEPKYDMMEPKYDMMEPKYDTMEPKYDKSSTVSSVSSLRVILAT